MIRRTDRRNSVNDAPEAVAPLAVVTASEDSVGAFLESLAAIVPFDGAVVSLHSPGAARPVQVLAAEGAWIDRKCARDLAGSADIAGARGERLQVGTLLAQGSRWTVTRVTVDDPESNSRVIVSAFFGASANDGGATQRCLLMIHSFFALWWSKRTQSAQSAALCSAHDALDLGILIVDPAGEMLHANRAAESMLSAGDCIRNCGRGFAAVELQHALAVQVALRHAIAANSAHDSHPSDGRVAPTLLVRSPSSSKHLMLWIVPVERTASRAGEAAAIVYLIDPSLELRDRLDPVCKLHGLSPIETRLVCHLSGGKSLQEAAATMRVKEQTARGYLKQAFLKTDTHRQADLVRMMLASVVGFQSSIEPVVLA